MRILLAVLISIVTFSSLAWSLTVEDAVKLAMQHSPQIKRAEAQVKASEARTGISRAPFWPSLEVDYRYWDADRVPGLASSDLSSASASVSYNLFNGGSDWFNLQAAKSSHNASEWQYKSTIADAVLAVRQAYIETLRAEQTLLTTQKSLELLDRQYHDAELRHEQGLIARNDLLRIAVEKATAQQNMVAAEGARTIARRELGRIIGQTLDTEEILAGTSSTGISLEAEEELLKLVLSRRSELKYLHSQLKSQESGRKAVYGDFLPDVDLSYSEERFGNKTFPDSDDTDFDDDSITMLEASWTLFSGFETRYELAVRKQEMIALKEEIRATEDLLRVQLTKALEDYRIAEKNLETAGTSLALAEENYRVNENRYKAQVATTVDLLDAQEFLTRARNEELKARYDLYRAEAAIDRVLERNHPVQVTSDE